MRDGKPLADIPQWLHGHTATPAAADCNVNIGLRRLLRRSPSR